MSTTPQKPPRAITLRSISISILAMLIMAMITQHIGVTDAWGLAIGNEPLAVQALAVFGVVVLLSGGVFALTRWRIVTRAEQYVILYALLVAAPLMAQAFWRYMLAFPSGVVRRASFESTYDGLPPKLWPHGPNLLAGVTSTAAAVSTRGAVAWREQTLSNGMRVREVCFTNSAPNRVAALRITLPLTNAGPMGVAAGVPYLITTLARAEKLGGTAYYFCRVYDDDDAAQDREVFVSRKAPETNALQPDGAVRAGMYGVRFNAPARGNVTIEFGLHGEGAVCMRALELYDVSAIEDAHLGRKLVTRSQFERLDPNEHSGLIVVPDRMASWEGLRFIVCGYVPWRVWLVPIAAWGGWMALVLATLFAITALLRRQWTGNERYPLPMAQPCIALLGEPRDELHPFAGIWRNRMMWAGFIVTLVWCVLRAWRMYNPNVPDVSINVALQTYFDDPGWGRMWDDVTIRVSSLTLGLALFMELHVLLSMVVGYLLFRSQYWLGEQYGLAADREYPYVDQQQLGAYLMYALLILWFTRKHWWRVVRVALGAQTGMADEALTYRGGLLTLAATLAGMYGWARWVGLRPEAMLLFFAAVVATGLTAARLRAECGTPSTGFMPTSFIYVLPLLGGLSVFGAQGVIFATFAAALITSKGFCQLPGLQVELVEVGRRLHVRRRQVVMTVALGVGGAIVIGGWVYLSSLYAIGAQNYPIVTAEFVGQGNFKVFTELVAAGGGTAPTDTAVAWFRNPRLWGLCGAAGVTALIAFLRQAFAGFWFHPIGFITAATPMAVEAWGSFLLAWIIRFAILKLGGAITVRTKLLPFASGMVFGTVAAYMLFGLVKAYLYYFHPSSLRFYMQF